MDKDRLVGIVLTLLSLSIGATYTYALFFAGDETSMLVLKLTALATVGSFLLVLLVIGVSLVLYPPPVKVEEIERKLSEELRKLKEKGYPFPWVQ
ncbi:transcriptional regulator [Infirmifilum lucidum]|uniref:Transcriptional regulator n=1 Tax=Infirmifilum lucidum TaxID=2776706 RepID=A0A7L9FJ59_9CREN|nr:transcriptional regulator [Infirmifilum lucidum]QOJ79372.1 transcriptional regulator [Infirmifilum lucidum]